MATIPLKSQYGPTLGTLLAPRWHAAPKAVRGLVRATAVGVVGLAGAGALPLWPAPHSHGGAAPFHFSYRGLYRTTPEPGQYVRIDRRANGRLEDSFAVSPLHLPPYAGGLSGEAPGDARGYIEPLAPQ